MVIDISQVKSYVLTLKDSAHRLQQFQNNVSQHLNVTPFYGERYPTVDEGCYKSTYKLYTSTFGQQFVIKLDSNTCIPFDPANTDYQEYLRWLEAGNTPEPADQGEQ